MSGQGVLLFVVVGQNDQPIYEADLRSGRAAETRDVSDIYIHTPSFLHTTY